MIRYQCRAGRFGKYGDGNNRGGVGLRSAAAAGYAKGLQLLDSENVSESGRRYCLEVCQRTLIISACANGNDTIAAVAGRPTMAMAAVLRVSAK